MTFAFETDLLKHHVRVHGWLPVCKRRLATIREQDTSPNKRRLRYFTFCAVGAIDVLMLDVAKIIRPSESGFDTVFFFDKSPDAVAETLKRIPGAVGFPGEFTRVVLLDDPEEENLIDSIEALASPPAESDNRQTRQLQVMTAQRRDFIGCFPFDVVNLDLEEFLFKPNDPLPGRLVNAMRRILLWQQRPFIAPNRHSPQHLTGFTLMFTTRVGPPNISAEYLGMLRDYMVDNLQRDGALIPSLAKRSGGIVDVPILEQQNFDLFFQLAVPKVIASILRDTDWYVDPEGGIKIFQFQRNPPHSPAYQILHLVMDVCRQDPPNHLRAPGMPHPDSDELYRRVARSLFAEEVIRVDDDSIDAVKLQESLNLVIARRRKYFPDV